MNNDYLASKANHGSMSSNNPIAKRISSNNNKRNNPNNFQINKENSPNKNSKYNLRSKYQNNLGQIRSPYQEEIVTGYYINSGDEDRYTNENGKEEGIDIEENMNMENGEEKDNLNDEVIGDGEYVRYDMTNDNNYNNDYSPNLNGQDIYAYYNLRNINNNLNNSSAKKNSNNMYSNDPKEYTDKNEEENNEEYIIESPEKNNNVFRSTNYNYNNNNNNKIYQKRRIFRNLRDSASSEAYAIKSNTRSTITENKNHGIYIKPRKTYNISNINNGISTEERGIESLKKPYEIIEESPIYDYPQIPQQDKGGKVDLNLSLNKLKNMRKNNKKQT